MSVGILSISQYYSFLIPSFRKYDVFSLSSSEREEKNMSNTKRQQNDFLSLFLLYLVEELDEIEKKSYNEDQLEIVTSKKSNNDLEVQQ